MGQSGKRSSAQTDSRGQSEVIGIVLLLGLAVIGTGAILVFGGSAITDTMGVSQTESTEHAMTLFDSRSAMVALGDSPSQTIDFGNAGDGIYSVEDESGWMRIEHHNYSNGQDQTIYNESLGAMTYEQGGTKLAYEGGGVWRKQGNGSVMVSPPEFHYRQATLTLPIIRVSGDEQASGRVSSTIRSGDSIRRVFPDATTTYDETGDPYANPIEEGNVTIIVQSDYYQAWAKYFDARTEGKVSTDHDNETATVKLITRGTLGEFEMPADGNSIDIRGLSDEHTVEEFNITVYPEDKDASEFSNLQWTLYAESGSDEFEIHLKDSGPANDPNTDCKERNVSATVYYSGSSGDPYQGWYEDDAFTAECYDGDGSGENDQTRLIANLTGDTQLEYRKLSNSDLNYFSPGGKTIGEPIELSGHDGDPDGEFYANDGDTTSIGNLTNHYFAQMSPSVELTIQDKHGGTVNEDASAGTFYYGGSNQFVTYLHVTENEVNVTFN